MLAGHFTFTEYLRICDGAWGLLLLLDYLESWIMAASLIAM